MLLGAVLIHALHAALEDREVVFTGVGGLSMLANVFPGAVVDRAMGGKFATNSLVDTAFVGMSLTFAAGVRNEDFAHGSGVGVLDVECPRLAL